MSNRPNSLFIATCAGCGKQFNYDPIYDTPVRGPFVGLACNFPCGKRARDQQNEAQEKLDKGES